ncbi:MAG: asparagine synthase (glutamine-hydrolyzing) [Planctomycetaceae bacterium]|nr:asparagine synthase (glutamine-hydrolyzing) [Planctomycetaceae bacterium]|tara:strand:+ start:15722 stop:17587 length:1866 start_codon:yes stop_codon:yes gene_type:complete
MCGIVTICSNRPGLNAGPIVQMTEDLAHRGPDADGVVQMSKCHLGHRRLQVIDPVGGQQPMWDDSRRFCVTFNGEIYNFRELRRELQTRGVDFHTHSDTEVLLLGYREYGSAVVEKLNGQFAFAIWDEKQSSLFAARDRLGEKPLFWAQGPAGELIIGSEIKAILKSELVRPMLDPASVDAYLALIYVPPDRTIYQNIHALPPGHALEWQSGAVHQWSYWQPRLSTNPIDQCEAVGEVRRLTTQAVERQMVADTPVGAFLSGGLDSATIVGLMAGQATAPIKTFSVGFGDLINELPYAEAVAQQYRTEHHAMQMDIPVGETLLQMARVYDEPFGDSSNIPTYLISQFAGEHVKVVLSGDGGDELFGGYDWYSPLQRQESMPSSSVLSTEWYRLLSCLPLGPWRRHASTRFKDIRAKNCFPDLWDRHLAALSVISADHRASLWGGSKRESAEDLLSKSYRPNDSIYGIDRATDFDLRCYLPGDIFVKVDRAAMAHGLETRSPFMDVDLVEFVLSLPARLRFAGPPLKSILRRACADLWPEPVRARNKQGFGAPIQSWLQRPDVRTLRDRVFHPQSPLLELLPGAAVIARQCEKKPQVTWNLLCLGLWLESHPCDVGKQEQVA